MVARLGFSIAVHTEPDVLVIDEVLAVGDAGFRNKCFAKIKQICENAAVIFISHNIHSVNRICDRVILMDQGKVIHEYDDIATGIEKYLELFRQIKPKIEQKSHIDVEAIHINDSELEKQSSVKFGDSLKISVNGFSKKEAEVEIRLYFLSLNLENLAVVSSSADKQQLLIKDQEKFNFSVEVPKVMLGVEKAYITMQISDKMSGERVYQNYAMTMLTITDHHEPFFSPNICEGKWS
jgi:lipopolysaccharide transport system ATP-binding protein